ncbi:uncharacterized protein SPPG_08817 [Spizellomyces punctatus DAOM BR117]|uniref:SH3 domain-containing protein n=1 Tax=Spizellomyces punctatus (strain DAOM BR117) TaxID=645134 RepID=A0A0L0HSN2_SPIPD|nr:uncharacterized protein SPPG_08817 [Spizellomyces punctatus DAOM BR117]KND04376.1 hypothetical protein SPPG_08817 [Spizellomyces punctatus DAOM BR117]|eukprot:XP_016612415.1 hypothetical protein SPPG_08817 [Spizellomyces punctatus DAOM BR117]
MGFNGQGSDGDTDDEYDIESPDIIDPDEPIDFGLVYALHTFVANLEGQVCVLKGDSLELLDDSNSYWWLVKCIKTDEIGYIPAENVETPFERLARLNKMRNVSVTTVQEEDLEPPPPSQTGKRRNIVFPEDFVEYIDASDDDDLSDEFDAPEMGTIPRQQKSNHNSLSRNFLTKLLSRTGSKKAKEVANAARSLERPVVVETRRAPSNEELNKEPINVLRIYAGNVDLKATFKTVNLTKSLTASELLAVALRRFRVPGATPNEYYVSVLHMDSQEKRLGENDNVFNVLEELRHKGLPGVGDSASVSHVVNSTGGISSVRMTDDNIIKVIINKKLNLFEKNYHLIRIFMYDESDPTGKMRTYKTIGVNSNVTVGEIIDMALKKFKIRSSSSYKYTLHSIFKGQEIMREDTERVYPILMMAEGTAEEIDFVLRKEWTGQGTAPAPSLASSVDTNLGTSLLDDIQSILSSKPAFLEELPAAGGMPDLRVSPQLSTDSIDTSSVTSSNSPMRSRNDSSDSLSVEQRQLSPLRKETSDQMIVKEITHSDFYDTTSLIGRILNEAPQPPSVLPSKATPPPRVNARASSLRYDPGVIAQATLMRLDSNASFSEPPPSKKNSTLHSVRETPPTPPAKDNPSIETTINSKSTYSSPPDLSPPDALRQGEPQTRQAVPILENVQLQTQSSSVKSMSPTGTAATAAGKPTTNGTVSPLDGEAVNSAIQGNGTTKASRASITVNPVRSSRANFETMEEYLEEILKGADVQKLRSLEARLRETIPIPPRGSSKAAVPELAVLPRPYDDCGLNEILRPRTVSMDSTTARKNVRKGSTASVSLSDVYNTLQADLEESLQSTRRQPAVDSKQPEESANTSQSSFDSFTSASEGVPDEPADASPAEPAVPAVPDVGNPSEGRLGTPQIANTSSSHDPESSREDIADDSAIVLEKYKEVEQMLNTMQADLEALVAKAVDAFQADPPNPPPASHPRVSSADVT